jgi:hypothetical protein
VSKSEQVRVEGREQPAEVEQLRHRHFIDVGACVSHDLPPRTIEQPDAERRARHAGQVLHHPKRVAGRPGYQANLFLLDA